MDPAVIVPGLLIGSRFAAENRSAFESNGIKFVVNTSKEIPSYFKDDATLRVTYLNLHLTDSKEDDIKSCFGETFDFIDSAITSGASVLVHCQAGISRSATIVIAYLMRKQKMTLRDAYFHAKSKKHNIQPNIHFFSTLQDFERQLTGSDTTFSLFDYHIDVLSEMGFDSETASNALKRSENDFNLALNICLGGF
eukprot:TRINITY_DN21951_c0_g1_i1.p1 TRINITY_DN21951_c0_g1~~TRINITY_DN21951_c0_g1_i1.p1  ORF type:complete len:211 (+),score=15.54 TRINITY_DN21951_c0_g1_i1:51-635(+)